jgi:hypothetical protein
VWYLLPVPDVPYNDYRKLKHPTLVGLLQRVIAAGFYDGKGGYGKGRKTNDCFISMIDFIDMI